LPLESNEGLLGIVLELLGWIQSYVKGIAYLAFDNGFQYKKLLEELQRHNVPFILPLHNTAKFRKR